jgi:hypothetical protein
LDNARLFCLAMGRLRVWIAVGITFEVELLGSKRGKFWGGADTRRDADRDGMELDRRLLVFDANGTGVALGDRDNGRLSPFGPGRTVVLALAPLKSLATDALDRPRGLVGDLPTSEERAVDREMRVEVSDGVLLLFGGIFFALLQVTRC